MDSIEKLNLSKLTDRPITNTFVLDNNRLTDLALEINVYNIDTLRFVYSICKNESIYILKGVLYTDIKQECSLTGEILLTHLEINIQRQYKVENINQKNKQSNTTCKNVEDLFTTQSTLNDEIDILPNYTLNILYLIQEELLLNIDPYIKKV